MQTKQYWRSYYYVLMHFARGEMKMISSTKRPMRMFVFRIS